MDSRYYVSPIMKLPAIMTRTIAISIFLQLLTFGLNCFGQTISGTVIDQKGDTLMFAVIVVIDNGQETVKTTSDLEGQFIFKDQTNYSNKKIYAKFGNCTSDTITVNQYLMTNLIIIVSIKDDCVPKIEIPNCRTNYIMKGMYYVDISDFSNDELKVVTGEQIATKEYSPYDYQMIAESKKYKADNGQIFTGQQIIRMKKLPIKDWDKADFKPIDEE